MNLAKLQNGSDLRGIALAGVPGEEVNLTEKACRAAGRGFALFLTKRYGKERTLRVAIGRDSRLSGERLSHDMCEALTSEGIAVFDVGLASTPAMFMSTVTEGFAFDGAVMVTASHLPFNRNGFKFFVREGGLESSDIRELLALAESGEHTGLPCATVEKIEFMPTYAALLADLIRRETGEDKPLAGLHIVVDAGNGAGGFYANEVLKPLGADISGSRFLDPDGRFPNHIPNPEDGNAMKSITEAVLDAKADFGIIFDTDVDRAGAVLSDGSELNRNRIIAILAVILLRKHPGTTIVTDSVTSTGLAAFIHAKGGVHHRFKRGYRNVIDEAIRLNEAGQDAQLAMETSGHGALKENYFLDDGAYLVTKLVIELVKGKKEGYTLESLIADLREPAERAEARMKIADADFRTYGKRVLADLEGFVSGTAGLSLVPNNYEGVRVNADDKHGNGWFLLRLSLHEPLLSLAMESDSAGGVAEIKSVLRPFLTRYDKLDLSKFS